MCAQLEATLVTLRLISRHRLIANHAGSSYNSTSRATEWRWPHDAWRGAGVLLLHLRRDWARPCHICAGTGLTPATSAPGLGALSWLSSFVIASAMMTSSPEGSDTTAAPSSACCTPPATTGGGCRCRMSISVMRIFSRCRTPFSSPALSEGVSPGQASACELVHECRYAQQLPAGVRPCDRIHAAHAERSAHLHLLLQQRFGKRGLRTPAHAAYLARAVGGHVPRGTVGHAVDTNRRRHVSCDGGSESACGVALCISASKASSLAAPDPDGTLSGRACQAAPYALPRRTPQTCHGGGQHSPPFPELPHRCRLRRRRRRQR
jgi:hypothetical protein